MIKKAYNLAFKAHLGQKRKGGEDFINHPLRVFEIAKEYTNDENILSACLLHDTLEDTDLSKDDILKTTNEEVLYLIENLTRNNFKSSKDYMRNIKKDKKLSFIKLIDRISNLEDLEKQDDLDFIRRYKQNTKENYLDILEKHPLNKKLKELL